MAGLTGAIQPTILVVDDDREICDLVRMYLENESYQVIVAHTGEDAIGLLRRGESSTGTSAGPISLIILDIMLPGASGLDVVRQARQLTDAPILMLSARDRDIDKAHALGLGADDYLTKPFSPIELVARVKANWRRYSQHSSQGGAQQLLEAGPIRVDLAQRRAWVRGEEIGLTAKELDLLALFASHPGQVFTRSQLFSNVWGETYLGDDNTVTVHIHRLRARIELDPDSPQLIRTIWGIGYRLEVPV